LIGCDGSSGAVARYSDLGQNTRQLSYKEFLVHTIVFRRFWLMAFLFMLLAFALAACQSAASATPTAASVKPAAPTNASVPGGGGSAAADYCVSQGGRVITRRPVYGTNLPESDQIPLRTTVQFCNFEARQVENPDTGFRSQIEIDVDSLYADAPTLALLAYLQAAPPDLTGVKVGVNPSTIHCGQLGGSTIFGRGDDPSGGGWVKATGDTTNAFDVMALCLFADGSAIDTWGITYHSDGTVRGVPLEEVARYKPKNGYPQLYKKAQ
jgi:putative hemolysin